MKEAYLWDRSGRPDPELERLERTLGELRFTDPPRKRPVMRSWQPAALAATLLIAVALWQITTAHPATPTPWKVNGAPLAAGQSIRADQPGVLLTADEIGRVALDRGAHVRLVESRPGLERLDLTSGRIHALIWAPPRQFVVDTPSSRAVDLGCQYTLSVEPGGDGLLDVETGWVAFQHGRNESFIPAGARCRTRKQMGPGTPFYRDAPEALASAVDEFDRTGDRGALSHALAAARPRDAITLWHLLTRAPESERSAVFDRFSRLVDLPASVSREGVVRGDRIMLDACWQALGMDSADWWREWKRAW